MDFIRIDEDNFSFFEDILFLESHTGGLPIIMLGAAEDGRPVAAAAIEVDGRVARLFSLYVEKDYRRKGIGARLIKELSELSDVLDFGAFEVDFEAEEGISEFFKSAGFELFFGNEVLYLPMDEIVGTKRFIDFLRKADTTLRCVPFSALSDRQLKEAYRKAGITYDGALQEQLNQDCSAVLMGQDQKPKGIISVMNAGGDIIITELKTLAEDLSGIAALFIHLYRTLKGKQGRGLGIGFIGLDDAKQDLVSEIAGDMIDFEKGETIVHGVMG
ncbi:MAG: GNAT family N-acetyltransferase [Lachnospiraceae bacterium]|nr:GNAT family N-acetyltransferase [Lachnospiraceae bacterium]